jgi:hypothetical protein
MWSDTTFLFTAYTGAAASLFGGVTISKAAFINQRKPLSQDDRNEWQDVRILIIDEVSFMSDSVLKELDIKLKAIGKRTIIFGGFSIIFSGDFRQLEPVCSNEKELLFSTLSSGVWENNINVVIILNNDHRFKDDPQYGKMLKRMWTGDLSKEDRKVINSRVIGYNGLKLPPVFKGKQFENILYRPVQKKTQQKNYKTFYSELENYDLYLLSCYFEGDACYACPTNKERNSIQKALFQKHINTTHPSITCKEMPLNHTLIIEANISSSISKKSQHKIDRHLKKRMILTTCGDADVMSGTKHIDPALCIYIGSSLLCIDNKHMKDRVPRGNGTLCRVLGVKLKENAPSHRVKNYYGKKYGQSIRAPLGARAYP